MHLRPVTLGNVREKGVMMVKIPDDKEILTAAKQILKIYEGDVLDATLHAARLSDEFLEKGTLTSI